MLVGSPVRHCPLLTVTGLILRVVSLLFGNMSPHPVLFWIGFLGSLFLASMVLNAQVYLLGIWADQYVVETAGPEPMMWR